MRPFQGLRLSFIGFPDDEKKHMEETAVENGTVSIYLPTIIILFHSLVESTGSLYRKKKANIFQIKCWRINWQILFTMFLGSFVSCETRFSILT